MAASRPRASWLPLAVAVLAAVTISILLQTRAHPAIGLAAHADPAIGLVDAAPPALPATHRWNVCWSTGFGWEEHYTKQLLSRVSLGQVWRSKIRTKFGAAYWKMEENAMIQISEKKAAFCGSALGTAAEITPLGGVILIIRNRQGSSVANLAAFERLVGMGTPVAIVAYGDEGLVGACGEGGGEPNATASLRARAALYTRAPLVIKNYWSLGCAALPNVMIVPFATKSGVEQTSTVRHQWPRQYAWSFLSSHNTPTRRAALSLMLGDAPNTARLAAQLQPRHVHFPEREKGAEPLDAAEYTNITCSSAFALAPTGNVHEVMRVAEAIDCGAIPILTGGSSYFAGYFPKGLVETFVDLGDLSHLLSLSELKPWTRGIGKDKKACEFRGASACAASRTAASDGLELLAALVRDDRALRLRREAMISAWEAWDWTGAVARRLGEIQIDTVGPAVN